MSREIEMSSCSCCSYTAPDFPRRRSGINTTFDYFPCSNILVTLWVGTRSINKLGHRTKGASYNK